MKDKKVSSVDRIAELNLRVFRGLIELLLFKKALTYSRLYLPGMASPIAWLSLRLISEIVPGAGLRNNFFSGEKYNSFIREK